MTAESLAFHFRIGAFVLHRNLAGLTHEESLIAPRPGGNHLNWIVGHVVRSRNQALALVGAPTPYSDAEFEAYGAEGDANAVFLTLDDLRGRFDRLGEELEGVLAHLDDTVLQAPAPFSPTGNTKETVATLLQSIAFHEAYHLGQTGILRRLLGKPGALLAPGEAGHEPPTDA